VSADLSSRTDARRRLDKNIVVEAGAGTGKTTLLTDRILFLLLAGGPDGRGVPLPRVVALTFTEKAAGEIKLRLADRLHDLLTHLDGRPVPPKRWERLRHWLDEARAAFQADDERLRAFAQQALRDLDRAPLGTLHHFCGTLLNISKYITLYCLKVITVAGIAPRPMFIRLPRL
jgi:ATP-dependent helicase/nuclease subunit A